jgi:hypothetical protein
MGILIQKLNGMRKYTMKTYITFIILLVFFIGCNDDSALIPDSSLVVVQAYLYANEPINDIRLTSTVAIDADSIEAPGINDAQIFLIKSGQQYDLISNPGKDGYYHYPDDDLNVGVGDNFRIVIEYNEKMISAETHVPEAPEELEISDSELEVIDFFELGYFDRSLLDSAAVEVSWENTDGSLYFIVLDNIEENPIEIESQFPSFANRFISQPINRDSFPLNFRMVTHYGKHRVKLYRINQEYADLYESRDQDSRDLNEPLTNVENGLGIFSAFNCDSVFFTVVGQ